MEETFDAPMEVARSMVTCVLADNPEAAIELVRDAVGEVNMMNVMLALAVMAASAVETLAASTGQDTMKAWQDSILYMMSGPE
jgi:hypothetical protein